MFFRIFEPAKVLEMKRKANSNGVGFFGVYAFRGYQSVLGDSNG